MHRYISISIEKLSGTCKTEPLFFNYLCQISAFGTPHRSSPYSNEDCSWDNGVELWIKLHADVNGIAEHAYRQRPFDRQVFNENTWKKHARYY